MSLALVILAATLGGLVVALGLALPLYRELSRWADVSHPLRHQRKAERRIRSRVSY